MLKKLQRKFMTAVMLAMTAVMFALIIGINLLNAYQMERSQDDKIRLILEYDKMRKEAPPKEQPPIYDMPWAGGADTEFTTRFFIVHCDKNGNVRVFGNEYISSIDEATAQLYTKEVLQKGMQKGDYNDYRYRIAEEEDELILVFLNTADAGQFKITLFLVSVLIGVCSLFIVFLLVLLFVRPAMKPYMRTMERQKRFITDAGHELKTPITSIATSADIIAMEYEDNEWVKNIQQQIIRLTKLVNDLVTLSRLDEEMPYPEKSFFSMSEAAWEITEPFSVMARAKGKTFTQSIEENMDFYGERNAIQQMLSILLDNAVKYSKEGGEIRLTIWKQRGKINIELYNTCEFQKNLELEHIFDRFYRPDESRSAHTGGSGIGLSIAQMIVVTHGGKIRVRQIEEKAILFKVLL